MIQDASRRRKRWYAHICFFSFVNLVGHHLWIFTLHKISFNLQNSNLMWPPSKYLLNCKSTFNEYLQYATSIFRMLIHLKWRQINHGERVTNVSLHVHAKFWVREMGWLSWRNGYSRRWPTTETLSSMKCSQISHNTFNKRQVAFVSKIIPTPF